jgi:hypothetical protein
MTPHPLADRFRATVATYLRGLERFDIDAMVALFRDDAMIHTPLFGALAPRPLFEKVRDSSAQNRIELVDVLVSADGAPRAIGYFVYDRGFKDGSRVRFDCCDIFAFDPDGLVARMTIVYDTHLIRANIGDAYA